MHDEQTNTRVGGFRRENDNMKKTADGHGDDNEDTVT